MTQQQNSVLLPEGYRPSAQEDYMNPQQQEYFRRKLLAWKAEVLEETRATLHTLQKETRKEPEQGERASRELERSIELRARDRQRKLLLKIDHALQLIEDGEYGYCAKYGVPIGLARLEARPFATLSLEAQEEHESSEKIAHGHKFRFGNTLEEIASPPLEEAKGV